MTMTKKATLRQLCLAAVLAGLALSATAQTIKEEYALTSEKNMEPVWAEKDADFANNSIPEKWNGYSGVILAQKTAFVFDIVTRTDRLNVYETGRRKIKLLDKGAVSAYSELYFRKGHSKDGFSAHVIKPNGLVDTVPIASAVQVEDLNDVPATFAPYFDKHNSKSANLYYKLPVGNLEPGDIIDYCYTIYNDNNVNGMNSLEFDPVYYLCHREYPVMVQKFAISTDERSYVNSRSLNGAPALTEAVVNGTRLFAWEDRNREKLKDDRWVNAYLSLPLLKFQIIYSKKENAADLFIGNRGELKVAITPEELAKRVNRIYEKMDAGRRSAKGQQNMMVADYTSGLLSNTEHYLRKYEAYDASDAHFPQRVYYVLRHFYGLYGKSLGSQYFAYVMLKKLEKKKIPAELIVTTRNDITEMKDVIFGSELEWLVRVNGQYIFNFSTHSNMTDLKDHFLQNTGYLIKLGDNPTATALTLPGTAEADNLSSYMITASMDANNEHMNVESVSAFKGISREDNNGAALAYTNVYEKDYLTYYGSNEMEDLPGNQQEEWQRLLRAQREEFKKRKPEQMKKNLERTFAHVVKYDEFLMITDGRSFANQELKYSEKYVLGDLGRRAGNHYLISVPGLMGGQVQVKPENRTRQFDIDVRNPRTILWDIRFTIPQGYVVKGLPDLNVNVDNETGQFTTQATIEGNILKLNIKKVYRQALVKKENFGKMLEFLDAAYNFGQRKILLKKG
jgi:hypothetical protein